MARVSPDVDTVIEDEVLRARIRQFAEERPLEPFWERSAKHPLVTLALGFALTWGLGTLLTGNWQQRKLESDRALEQERRSAEARISVVGEFLGVLYEHQARAFMVERALQRDAPIGELRELVRAERELFPKTNAKLGLLLFTLRSLLRSDTYQPIVQSINNGIYVPLQTVDQAHAIAFEDHLLRRRPPMFTPAEERRAEEASTQATSCSQAVAEAFWFGAIASPNVEQIGNEKKAALKQMNEACEPDY